MSAREHIIKVSLSDGELAVLDERRGVVPRAVYLRRTLHGGDIPRDVATRSESLALLTELARERRTAAVIALARELRDGDDRNTMDWIMNGP